MMGKVGGAYSSPIRQVFRANPSLGHRLVMTLQKEVPDIAEGYVDFQEHLIPYPSPTMMDVLSTQTIEQAERRMK